MNVKGYQVVKNKLFCKSINREEMVLDFTDAVYRALTSLEHCCINTWQSVLFCNVVGLKTCIY